MPKKKKSEEMPEENEVGNEMFDGMAALDDWINGDDDGFEAMKDYEPPPLHSGGEAWVHVDGFRNYAPDGHDPMYVRMGQDNKGFCYPSGPKRGRKIVHPSMTMTVTILDSENDDPEESPYEKLSVWILLDSTGYMLHPRETGRYDFGKRMRAWLNGLWKAFGYSKDEMTKIPNPDKFIGRVAPCVIGINTDQNGIDRNEISIWKTPGYNEDPPY